VSQIRALSCREWVAKQYSVEAMADGYEALIGDLVKEEVRLRQA
jgi:hypothetical protein